MVVISMVQSAKTASRKAESRIQQLCCLGLGDQIAIPAILRELHDYIPSHANCFFWSDSQGNIQNLYDERPQAPELLPLYLAEFHNQLDLEVFCGWQKFLRSAGGAVDYDSMLTVNRRRYETHCYYGEFARKLDFHWGLFVVVREHGRPLGALALHRSRGERRFDTQDAHRLDRILPFVAHAFVAVGDLEHDWTDSDEEGLLITNSQGDILHTSGSGKKLLALACSDRLWPPSKDGASPKLLKLLCQQLVAVRRAGTACAPPTATLANAWGRFVLRAHALQPFDDSSTTVGISIRRQEPMSLKLLRCITRLPLSRTQSQVCLLMVQGLTYNQIAERQCTKRNTAISHGREIYNRLDVHNREQLLARILAAPVDSYRHQEITRQ